jgi:hypothetical protein
LVVRRRAQRCDQSHGRTPIIINIYNNLRTNNRLRNAKVVVSTPISGTISMRIFAIEQGMDRREDGIGKTSRVWTRGAARRFR